MTEKNDGGQAFPVPGLEHDKYWYPGEFGMTLRDYFAAKAMQGSLADSSEVERPEKFAKWCYEMADAMLAARTK